MTPRTSQINSNTPNPKSLWKQRLGYGVADLGCNLVWQMMTIYQLYFFTDVVGIDMAVAGFILLVSRLIDGAGGIVMGLVIDRTNSRWGKSRPFLLWGALPFAVLASLTFYTPEASLQIRTLYAFITSILVSLSYTMVNLPLTSILPNIEASLSERTNLVTSRIFFSFVGSTIVSSATLPLIGYFGMGDLREGFSKTMLVYGSLAGLTIIFSFLFIREKMQLSKGRADWKKSLHALKDNRPWKVFAINIVFMWGAFFIQQGSFIYFLKYCVGANVGFTTFIITLSTVVPVLGTLIVPLLSRVFDKKIIFMVSSAVHMAGILLLAILPISQTVLIYSIILSSLGFGVRHIIYFSMQADPVDYGRRLTGVDSSGTIASLNQFIGKITMAAAGVIVGFMMSNGGYHPNVLNTPEVNHAIIATYIYLPILLIFVSMVIISRYKITDKEISVDS